MIGSRISSMSLTAGSFAGLSTYTIPHRGALPRRPPWCAAHERKLVFALETLLHDVHVQQSEKPAAKAEAEGPDTSGS